MPRPRRDGTPARAVNRRKLTDLFVSSRKPKRVGLVWDIKLAGTCAQRPAHREEGVESHLPAPTAARAGCISAMSGRSDWPRPVGSPLKIVVAVMEGR